MKYSKALLIILSVVGIFFYKSFLLGKIPFPGDLLLSQYAPWRHVSYDGYVAGSIPSKDQYFDVIRELYPWRSQSLASFSDRQIPLWNPHNGSGAPLLANWQSQTFYPLSIVYFLFPQIVAWTIMVILQPILGMFFTYLFSIEIGLSIGAAILTSLLFNFGSFAIVWMEFTTVWHTILWLPLLLYLVEKYKKNTGLNNWQKIVFVTAGTASLLGGHPQDAIHVWLFLQIYIFARRAKPLIPLTIVPFFLAAAQLLPTVELFHHSARVSHEYQSIIETMLIQLQQLPLMVISDYFGNPATKTNLNGDFVNKTLSVGIVGFFMVLSGIGQIKKNWYAKFFTLTGVFILMYTIRSPLTEFLYRYPLPILSTGTPTRILFLYTFAFAVLAGIGYDQIRFSPTKPILFTWIIFGILIDFAPLPHAIRIPAFVLCLATFCVIGSRWKPAMLTGLVPIALCELFIAFIKFTPFVPPSFIFPQNELITYLRSQNSIDRFWGYGTAQVEANFATQTRLYSTDNTDPLNLRWYNELIQAGSDGNIPIVFDRTSRSDALLAPGYGERDLPDNTNRLRLMDVLGVRFIIDRSENPKTSETFPNDRFKEIWHKEDWTVYENKKSAPRYFLTQDVRPYTDTRDFEQQFFSDTFVPGSTVLLEKQVWDTIPKFADATGTATLTLEKYNSQDVIFSVNSDAPRLLFLSDTYDNGWTATINGAPASVLKANWALRAIPVPSGNSKILLTYRPRSFYTGLAVSFIACFGFAVYIGVSQNSVYKKKKH